jgi:hypothetical protein
MPGHDNTLGAEGMVPATPPDMDALHTGFLEGDPDAILACLALYRPELDERHALRAAVRFRTAFLAAEDESEVA